MVFNGGMRHYLAWVCLGTLCICRVLSYTGNSYYGDGPSEFQNGNSDWGGASGDGSGQGGSGDGSNGDGSQTAGDGTWGSASWDGDGGEAAQGQGDGWQGNGWQGDGWQGDGQQGDGQQGDGQQGEGQQGDGQQGDGQQADEQPGYGQQTDGAQGQQAQSDGTLQGGVTHGDRTRSQGSSAEAQGDGAGGAGPGYGDVTTTASTRSNTPSRSPPTPAPQIAGVIPPPPSTTNTTTPGPHQTTTFNPVHGETTHRLKGMKTLYEVRMELQGKHMQPNLKTKPWKDPEVDPGPCKPRFQVRQDPPSLSTDLNGVELPETCFLDDAKGPHHIFVIGDWGGVIDWYDPVAHFVKSPKTADHTSKVFASHHRDKVNSSDTWAQFNVSRWMCYYSKQWHPDFVVNLGDNFYWGGINVQCGAPMDEVQDPGFQWSNVYESVYSCSGLEGLQWLGVLGNHDYGGFMFTNGWDQAIAYTWSKLKFSTGRWLQPALYYKCPVKYSSFTMDFFFVDSNIFDANDYHDTSGHNICGGVHNYPAATCGMSGPVSTEQCADWFKNLWDAEVQWLEAGLGSSVADWQVIATHFPPEHGVDEWRRLAKTYGVDLLLTAHRHIQEVHVDDEANLLHPTAYVVSGGGGGITSEAIPSETGEDDQYGFMDLTVSKHEIKITAVSHGGQIRNTKCLTQRLPGDDHTQEIAGKSLCDNLPPGLQTPPPSKLAPLPTPIRV